MIYKIENYDDSILVEGDIDIEAFKKDYRVLDKDYGMQTIVNKLKDKYNLRILETKTIWIY